ncbi:MAG: GDP-mannose 4,6-dehydratase [Cyanobacteriota bacterium]
MKQTVLITGAAGFIGSHLISSLIENNKIICVDDFNDFYSPEIKRKNIEQYNNNPDFKLYELDIAEYELLEKVFKENQVDKVVHLAARAGVRPSLIDPLLYTRTNINGTVNLLELSKNYNIPHFVFGSSSSVYGISDKVPFKEDFDIIRPISPYAATKVAGEAIAYTYSHLYDMRIICLRFFTVYGARQRPDLAIHKFTRLIDNGKSIPVFGDGSAKRDYTYIDDIIQGVLAALNYDKVRYDIFNLGESRSIELSYLIELIEENLGKKAIIDRKPSQPGDVPITYADITKAKSLLGYNPTTDIVDGIKEFVKWYKILNS